MQGNSATAVFEAFCSIEHLDHHIYNSVRDGKSAHLHHNRQFKLRFRPFSLTPTTLEPIPPCAAQPVLQKLRHWLPIMSCWYLTPYSASFKHFPSHSYFSEDESCKSRPPSGSWVL
ncbi:hypothetical protein RRG08_046610 [Elysia crispata]|uniref:Uncharacterized protein n=1 Tax=Elysia crispata TaxID=231223 RepID=A0AAE1E3F8_9GAST|nr:hypothetical protein RRG08_046610 [Elysia crispata]